VIGQHTIYCIMRRMYGENRTGAAQKLGCPEEEGFLLDRELTWVAETGLRVVGRVHGN
jgi:hypothetical protein